MDILAEQFDAAVIEGWLDAAPTPAPTSAGSTEDEQLADNHVWFSMRRVGYDADVLAGIEREPEFRWFG